LSIPDKVRCFLAATISTAFTQLQKLRYFVPLSGYLIKKGIIVFFILVISVTEKYIELNCSAVEVMIPQLKNF